MSRIGKKIIEIPEGVTVTVADGWVTVTGPKGELKQELHPKVSVEQTEEGLQVKIVDEENKQQRSLWGTFGSLISNMVTGVTEGYKKVLEVNGVGYKVAMQGNTVVLNVGYSHPVEVSLPEGITGSVEKNVITIEGTDKQVVGEVAANIRAVRKPEPYKGKGIKYMDEIIRRKAGKAASA